MVTMKILRNLRSLLPEICIAALGGLFQIRGYLNNGKLTGDVGDARSTLIAWEHWNQFYLRQENLRDLNIFYPAKNLLGASDPAFFQGILYTFWRWLGATIPTSFQLTIFMMSTLGYLGFALLSKELFKNYSYRIVFLILIIVSYQINTQSGHPQTYVYLMASWLVLANLWLLKGVNFRFSFATILISPPLIAISALYSMVFLGIIFCLLVVNFLIIDKKSTEKTLKFFQNLVVNIKSDRIFAFLVFLMSTYSYLFAAYIYWPYRNVENFSNSFAVYSPRLFDLVNQSTLAEGFLARLFEYLRLGTAPTFERAMGFSLVALGFFIFLEILRYRNGIKLSKMRIVISLLFLQLILLPLTDDRGQSVWQLLSSLPITDSVRVPSRIWIYAGFIFSYLIVNSIENLKLLEKQKFKQKYFSICLLFLLVAFEYRQPWAFWTKGDYFNVVNSTESKLIQDLSCESFYIAPPDENNEDEAAQVQIQSMLIATETGIPTINGYTSIPPDGWPSKGNWGRASESDIREWLLLNKVPPSHKSCYLDSGRIEVLKR
jgi:hypothetical protein